MMWSDHLKTLRHNVPANAMYACCNDIIDYLDDLAVFDNTAASGLRYAQRNPCNHLDRCIAKCLYVDG